MPRPSRLASLSAGLSPKLAALLAPVLLLGASACGTTSFEVVGRQTPVHVWLTAPTVAARGGSIEAAVHVGPYKVVDGPVRFPKGVATVILPTVYLRTGSWQVTVVLEGGRYKTTATANVEREGWVDITLRDRQLTATFMQGEPSRIGRGCR